MSHINMSTKTKSTTLFRCCRSCWSSRFPLDESIHLDPLATWYQQNVISWSNQSIWSINHLSYPFTWDFYQSLWPHISDTHSSWGCASSLSNLEFTSLAFINHEVNQTLSYQIIKASILYHLPSLIMRSIKLYQSSN